MPETCPFPIDPSNAATSHWLGLVAIVSFVAILCLVAAWLHARAQAEHLAANQRIARAAIADVLLAASLAAELSGEEDGAPWQAIVDRLAPAHAQITGLPQGEGPSRVLP